jgi:signal transduction histidine kinase
MLVSLAFSTVIYRMITIEVERVAEMQRIRIERRLGPQFAPLIPEFYNQDDIVVESKRRFLLSLGIVNGTILIIAGLSGYFLAGRTLDPIAVMVEEQKRFVSDSSHELRTPLTSLKSSLEVSLRDPKLKLSEAKELIKDSITEVDKLTNLSNNLLKLARGQYRYGQSLQPINLSQTLTNAIKQISPLAKNKKIKIVNQSQNYQLKVNSEQITEAFVILLDNAVKYSNPNSQITITTQKVDSNVQVTFSDQGIGIDHKDLPHIFDRFFRADTSRTKTDTEGYGLGLSIAKMIIEAHSGTIKVDSKIGLGSHFTISLPCFS